jgi:trehalose 6-phosphate synthase
MRITFRLVVSLILGITLVALVFSYLQVRQEEGRLREEIERRAVVLAESLQESVEPLLGTQPSTDLQRLVERFGNRERLNGVGVYDASGRSLAVTPGLPSSFVQSPPAALEAVRTGQGYAAFQTIGEQEIHIYALPLRREGNLAGVLLILHNVSHIAAQTASTWRWNFIRLLVQALLITAVTVIIVRWSIAGPIARTAEWMKKLRIGDVSVEAVLPKTDLFKPLAQEVVHLTKSLSAARAAAEEEARLREAAASQWTSERLKEHVRNKLQGRPLFVVSNREPYMHVRKGKEVVVTEPASGLVTALDPILRACDGTWVAHGAGDADQETVDKHNKLRVPPSEPQFTLKRVWLTKEEEEGYYYGFSNEGLWPLCHIAHTRPVFRAEDWSDYQAVNRRFAEAVLEELEGTEEPCLLIQDYHFALLPQLIKERRPDARVAIFWHIPWPNPEAFGICPWQKELLDGLLGADLIAFHIQFHCNNFLETVDRALESRIDWEGFAVNRHGHTTWVKPFPISVAFPPDTASAPAESPEQLKNRLFKELGVKATFLGVGVDRIDYTKGILERFRGIERFLEKYPAYQGQLTFVELGAPSRTHIKQYHDLVAYIEAEADRINWRFQTKEWRPIIFRKGHHTHAEIQPYYRAADFGLVTSLHDGMNLVAKEYVVASSEEGQGVLILSCFTGASRELQAALIVNPYDIEQTAEAIRCALEMDPEERLSRMQKMRRTVREANVYCWAANLVTELAQVQPERAEATTLQ